MISQSFAVDTYMKKIKTYKSTHRPVRFLAV